MAEGFTAVNVNHRLVKDIQKYMEEIGYYRNVSEFVNAEIREKLESIQKVQVNKRKLDAFFMREEQIKSKNVSHGNKTI